MAKDKTEIEGIKDKVREKRRKLAAKIAAKRAKIALKRGLALLALAVVAGCGTFERADPAARSARAQYTFGAISATGGSTIRINLGDGAMAAADGDGGITQPTTTTTSVPTSFSVPTAIDPVSLAIQQGGRIIEKGLTIWGSRPAVQGAATPCTDCAEPQQTSCPECEYRP